LFCHNTPVWQMDRIRWLRPGPRPTSVPSGIWIHPAIWPQETWAENWRGKGSWVPI